MDEFKKEMDEFKKEIITYIKENVKTLEEEHLIKLPIVQLVIIKTGIELEIELKNIK
ncbi:MAG: hypothetical protein H0V01_12915 [Bacteroidetes bacterium]|nr:hypothetical protein [Bacteroidota bacterium]HET6244969.1 hypothetical protein [Bacteroidia bacterium]